VPLIGKNLYRCTEEEPTPVKIIRGVAPMYGTVMVRTKQDEICESIFATATEPAHVVCLADVGTIADARRPATDLAGTVIEVAQLLHKFAVAATRTYRQIATALLCKPGGLVTKQPCDGSIVTGEQEGLQAFFRH
jgi:hypothetical protein